MPPPAPSRTETSSRPESEIRAVLLAAQEMEPGEVDHLIEPALVAVETEPRKDSQGKWNHSQFFCALFASLIWFLLMPWWAAYLLLNGDPTAAQSAAVILAVWAASILATVATLIRRFGMRHRP